MSIAIVIPAYFPNEEKTIVNTLKYFIDEVSGVKKNNLYLTWNGTVDPELLIKIKSICEVVNNPDSKSKAENLNGVIKKTKYYDYICFYDADARPEKESVNKLKKCIESNSNIGFVQGRFLADRGKNPLISLYDRLENRIHHELLAPISFRGHNAIIRSKVFKDIGDFNIFVLSEDTDMTLRILEYGYKGKYLSDHYSSIESPSTIKSFLKQRLRWIAGGYQVKRYSILVRLLFSIFWIFLYYIFFWETLIIGLILGTILTGNFALGVIFLFYPIISLLLLFYFFINGTPKTFKVTTRAGKIFKK